MDTDCPGRILLNRAIHGHELGAKRSRGNKPAKYETQLDPNLQKQDNLPVVGDFLFLASAESDRNQLKDTYENQLQTYLF